MATFVTIVFLLYINFENMKFFLGYEVDKLSKILIKTSNAAEYIESDVQNIEATRIDDHIILHVSENILTRFPCGSS